MSKHRNHSHRNYSHSKSQEKCQPHEGELFLVATPIGNLGDISRRALEVLHAVDRIACEDTRTSGVLMHHYGIRTPLMAYHTHNEVKATEALLVELQQGAKIALISDAGTPLLSDPGARLVQAAIDAGVRVTPIPGASALLSALTISGLSAERFYYAGFLPAKSRERLALLDSIRALPATLVFYEAPHRLTESLALLAETLGDRDAAVARELTKLYEECRRGKLRDLHGFYDAAPPRGECVIVVAGAAPEARMDSKELDSTIIHALESMRVNEAAAYVASISGHSKSEVYARALVLKEKR